MIKKGQQLKGTCRQLRGFQNRLDCAHVNVEGKVLGGGRCLKRTREAVG